MLKNYSVDISDSFHFRLKTIFDDLVATNQINDFWEIEKAYNELVADLPQNPNRGKNEADPLRQYHFELHFIDGPNRQLTIRTIVDAKNESVLLVWAWLDNTSPTVGYRRNFELYKG